MPDMITIPRVRDASITDPAIHAVIEAILSEQLFGVLGTSFKDQPHCSQMGFAASSDLRSLFVITPRKTTKYENMEVNPHVSFLISTAHNDPADPETARALTVKAIAVELDGERRDLAVTLFYQRHPALVAFTSSTDSAVMELKVCEYILVSDFQQITRIALEAASESGQEPEMR